MKKYLCKSIFFSGFIIIFGLLIFAENFPFELNYKYSYAIESIDIDFKTTQTEYGDYMLTASNQKFTAIGNHNFMYYKKAQYKNADGELKDCYYFIFYYELGRPTPEMKADGILVIEENGSFVYMKQVEQDMAEKSKFTTRGEKQGKSILISYLDETQKSPKEGSVKIDASEKDIFLDENFIYTFAVYLKLNNPWDLEEFNWRAFVPCTYVTSKDMIISSQHSPTSQVLKAHSLYTQPLFIKEGELAMDGENFSVYTTDFFEMKFVQKGKDSFKVAEKNINTKIFICSEYGISLHVDEEGDLIRLTIPGKRYTLVEKGRTKSEDRSFPK
ncbi:MAG: hypothetical protein PHV06_09020 [bacterium]|nr:hypothetical protein [bacterium]